MRASTGDRRAAGGRGCRIARMARVRRRSRRRPVAMARFFRTPRRATNDEARVTRFSNVDPHGRRRRGCRLADRDRRRDSRTTSRFRERTSRTRTARSTIRTSRRSCLRFSALREPEALEEHVARRVRVAAVEEVLPPAVQDEAEPPRCSSAREAVDAATMSGDRRRLAGLELRPGRSCELACALVDLGHDLFPERLVEGSRERREADGDEFVAVARFH